MSKTTFLKEQLALRGIFNYTEEDIKKLKETVNELISKGLDKYTAFEEAFKEVFREKKEVKR